MRHEGGCFCRAIRYEAEGPTGHVTHCHCRHCRGTSGAPFVTWAEFPTAGFRFTAGEPARFATRPGVQRAFCPACGTQLTFNDAATPDVTDVTVCSLDAAESFVPEDHVWADRMLTWLRMDDGLPRYGTNRDA